MWSEPGFEALPPEALRVRRIRGGMVIAGVALILSIIDVTLRSTTDLEIPLFPISIPALIIIVMLIGWLPWTKLSWKAWGWRLDDQTFQTRSGVYSKVWKGVPRDRVQFVEVAAGPLQRWAGLATLVVRTAGVRTPAVVVEDLRTDVAEDLREELSPTAAIPAAALTAPVVEPVTETPEPDDGPVAEAATPTVERPEGGMEP